MHKSTHAARAVSETTPQVAWQVSALQNVSYDVHLTTQLLDPDNSLFARSVGADGTHPCRRLMIIDRLVHELYGEALTHYFAAWKLDITYFDVPGDEASKSLEQATRIAEAMSDVGLLRRQEVVIAMGGGVLLDLVGFAASMYRRGVPYLRIPTTLMAHIDASIGIKTGVNHGMHKNRLGSYYPPTQALIDPHFLGTLSQRHIANGVAEIIKMALIKDHYLFELLEQNAARLTPETFASYDPATFEIISRAIDGMLEELEPNLWEANLERCVDYGHTFSPSLELRADPPILHGEAVAIDMALCLAIAKQRLLLSEADARRALRLIDMVGLPTTHPVFEGALLEKALGDAVKHRDGAQRVPLTKGLGHTVFANDITPDALRNALTWLQAAAPEA